MRIDPVALDSLRALGLGFAFAGLIASTFELVTERRASFRLLQGHAVAALACVPLVTFSAPYIILRAILRSPSPASRSFATAMVTTVIACAWSLASGRVVLDLVYRLAGV